MDLSGKVINQLPEVSGSSKSGNSWRKQEYIIETGGQYPKKVCVSIWGDKIDQFGLKLGEQVTLGIDVESREYNGRWYTEVKAYKVDRSQGGGRAPFTPGPQSHRRGECAGGGAAAGVVAQPAVLAGERPDAGAAPFCRRRRAKLLV